MTTNLSNKKLLSTITALPDQRQKLWRDCAELLADSAYAHVAESFSRASRNTFSTIEKDLSNTSTHFGAELFFANG